MAFSIEKNIMEATTPVNNHIATNFDKYNFSVR